jgi:phage-related protein (TIGR01555 family)
MARAPRNSRGRFTSDRLTGDSFQNFVASVGVGTNNIASGGSYGFNPISRNKNLLEWAYRGSWIVRKAVDVPAEDMTRQGVSINDDMPPDRIDGMQAFCARRQVWTRLTQAMKWARLYGGAGAAIVIKGQDFSQPLRMNTIGKGQFTGLIVLDRWMLQPSYSDLVTDPGEDYGNPVWYDVVSDARALPAMRIHHTRFIRFDGIELPYWQRQVENGWGLSILEPMWDRLIAFDSATNGAAQLVYKAHLRTLKLPKLRELIADGGPIYQAVLRQIDMIRTLQANEGLTLLDADDIFEVNQYSFAGLSDMIQQFGQQLSGSVDVPMTRLFGQSPAGMNSTGESDMNNYDDGLKSQQETRLRDPYQTIFELTHRSLFGEPLPPEFGFTFNPLRQLTQEQKSSINGSVTTAVAAALQDQIIDRLTAAKELRQLSRITGVFSNITDEYLAELAAEPPVPPDADEPPEPGKLGLTNAPGPRVGSPGKLGLTGAGAALPPQEDLYGDPAGIAGRLGLTGAGTAPAASSGGGKLGLTGASGGDGSEDSTAGQLGLTGASGEPPDPAGATEADPEGFSGSGSDRPNGTSEPTANGEPFRLGLRTRDSFRTVEYHGHTIVVETPKGYRRTGYGWAVQMPCDYGYISGTSSAEGPTEQMDAFVGPDLSADKVWVVEQVSPDTGDFDEHKVMIGFPSRADALRTYKAAFAQGDGADRIGGVRSIEAEKLGAWLSKWRYGVPLPPNTRDRVRQWRSALRRAEPTA